MSETCLVENSMSQTYVQHLIETHASPRALCPRALCERPLNPGHLCPRPLCPRPMSKTLSFSFRWLRKGMHRWSGTSLLEMLSSVAHKRYAPHCLNGLSLCPRTVCPKPLCPRPVCPRPLCPRPLCPRPVCPRPLCAHSLVRLAAQNR